MARFRALVFDWDGTVVETMPIKIANAGRLFEAQLGAQPSAVEAAYREHSGVPRRELFEKLSLDTRGRGLSEMEYRRLSAEFTRANLAAYQSSPESLQAVFDPADALALERLHRAGLVLYVSSAAEQEEIETLAQRLGIDRWFARILGSRPGFRKGVEHLTHVRSHSGFQTREIAFVGDERADIRLAAAVGVCAVGLSRPSARKERALFEERFADHVVASLAELADWVLTEEAGRVDAVST